VTIRTHNLLALVWWGLPVTVILARLVRWAAPMIAAHLPAGGPVRLGDYGVLGAVRHRWHITVISALLGSFSHLAWDAFTHPGYFSPLRHEVWPGTPWWGLLSNASDIAGFVFATILLIHIGRTGLLRKWHGPPSRATARPVAFWSMVALVLGAGMTLLSVHPTQWFAAQAIRTMLIIGLALLAGAAGARLAAQRSRMVA
jgi:hypothetical protein